MMKYFLPALAIVAIVVIELFAIKHGIDGIALTASVAALSGIGGFYVKKHVVK